MSDEPKVRVANEDQREPAQFNGHSIGELVRECCPTVRKWTMNWHNQELVVEARGDTYERSLMAARLRAKLPVTLFVTVKEHAVWDGECEYMGELLTTEDGSFYMDKYGRALRELATKPWTLPDNGKIAILRPWKGPQSFAQRHKPLAEAFASLTPLFRAQLFKPLQVAFASLAKAMQTPQGIVILNRQWCDEQVANPPRWARDGRGVARGERFEAFKVGLCKELAEFSSDRQDCWSGYRLQPRPVDAAFVLEETRRYVDRQCGEAPAW